MGAFSDIDLQCVLLNISSNQIHVIYIDRIRGILLCLYAEYSFIFMPFLNRNLKNNNNFEEKTSHKSFPTVKIVLCPRLIPGVPVEKIKSNEIASKNRQKWNYSIEKETKDVYPNE